MNDSPQVEPCRRRRWRTIRGRVIAGILCEISEDGRKLRFKRGARVEEVDISGVRITETLPLDNPQKPA